MAEIKQDLKLQSDPSTVVRPNIVSDNIPSGAVTSAKIAAGAVTQPKLGTSSVTSDKLAAGAVIEAKIADSAVTSTKLASGAVQNGNIANGAVTGDKIASGTIENANLRNYSVYGSKISRTRGLILDHDYGETFSDFVNWLKAAFEEGATFFYSDGSDYASCYLRVTDTQIDIVIPLPLTGYQSSYTVTSANFDTWKASEGSDIYACFIN